MPGAGLLLEGWLADQPDGHAFDEIYAVIEGKLYSATPQQRPDVAAAYKNPSLAGSGFRVRIAGEDLKHGLQRIEFIGVLNRSHALYRFAKPLYLEFR
jgi:hypothetical protein